jgi:hypothetical protein
MLQEGEETVRPWIADIHFSRLGVGGDSLEGITKP